MMHTFICQNFYPSVTLFASWGGTNIAFNGAIIIASFFSFFVTFPFQKSRFKPLDIILQRRLLSSSAMWSTRRLISILRWNQASSSLLASIILFGGSSPKAFSGETHIRIQQHSKRIEILLLLTATCLALAFFSAFFLFLR